MPDKPVSLIPDTITKDYDKWRANPPKGEFTKPMAADHERALLEELAFSDITPGDFLAQHVGEPVQPNPKLPLNSDEQPQAFQDYRDQYQKILRQVESAANAMPPTLSPGKKSNQAFTRALLDKWITLEADYGLYPPISLKAGDTVNIGNGPEKVSNKTRKYTHGKRDEMIRSPEGRLLATAILMLNEEIIAAQARLAQGKIGHAVEDGRVYAEAYDHARDLLFKYDPAVTSERATTADKSIRFNSYLTNGLKKLLVAKSTRETMQGRFWRDNVRSYTAHDNNGTEHNIVEGIEDPNAVDPSAAPGREPLTAAQLLDLIHNDAIFDAREQTVLKMRNGLGEYDRAYTLKEIGDQLGVSKERVRQIEKPALKRLTERALDLSDKQSPISNFVEDVATASEQHPEDEMAPENPNESPAEFSRRVKGRRDGSHNQTL